MLVARHLRRWFPDNSIATDRPTHVAQKASNTRGLSLCRAATPVSGLGHTISDSTRGYDRQQLSKNIYLIRLVVSWKLIRNLIHHMSEPINKLLDVIGIITREQSGLFLIVIPPFGMRGAGRPQGL